MNTKLLMTSSSLVLGAAGLFALFMPDVLLSTLDAVGGASLSALVQLTGALYFSFALMNWTAKDSAIGGIYARPVSLANLGHFFAGALLLVKYVLSNEFIPFMFVLTVVYLVYAAFFYWLVFRATGIKPPSSA